MQPAFRNRERKNSPQLCLTPRRNNTTPPPPRSNASALNLAPTIITLPLQQPCYCADTTYYTSSAVADNYIVFAGTYTFLYQRLPVGSYILGIQGLFVLSRRNPLVTSCRSPVIRTVIFIYMCQLSQVSKLIIIHRTSAKYFRRMMKKVPPFVVRPKIVPQPFSPAA